MAPMKITTGQNGTTIKLSRKLHLLAADFHTNNYHFSNEDAQNAGRIDHL